jgi:CBS domain-containing membrane protein
MKPSSMKVADIMTTAVLTIKVGNAISHADADMRLAGIRHLPVVDDRGRLVGMLSNRDLLASLARTRQKSVHVADVMTRDVKTISPDASARKAAALMLEHRIGSLAVVGDAGELVGVVTETDFLRLVHELLS